MDTQPHRSDGADHEQALSAWMATDTFTDFMTATFDAAVKLVVDEQAAKGVTASK